MEGTLGGPTKGTLGRPENAMMLRCEASYFWLEGLQLSHLSFDVLIHSPVIEEFFDDLNSVSVFDPVVVDGPVPY